MYQYFKTQLLQITDVAQVRCRGQCRRNDAPHLYLLLR